MAVLEAELSTPRMGLLLSTAIREYLTNTVTLISTGLGLIGCFLAATGQLSQRLCLNSFVVPHCFPDKVQSC